MAERILHPVVGRWVTDPADPDTIREYGYVTIVFAEDGRMTYILEGEKKDQVIIMHYRIEGTVLVTDQPSAPREERTSFNIIAPIREVRDVGCLSVRARHVMKTTNGSIQLSENDLKEIFSLLTSCTIHERNQIYDESSDHYYLKVEPLLEYSLTQEKREFALDAWRAVTYFLHMRRYTVCKAGQQFLLDFSNKEFID